MHQFLTILLAGVLRVFSLGRLHTHYNRMNSSPSAFTPSSPPPSHIFLNITLSRNKTEMWDTGLFSFSIITWFSFVNLIKVLPGRYYSTVKET